MSRNLQSAETSSCPQSCQHGSCGVLYRRILQLHYPIVWIKPLDRPLDQTQPYILYVYLYTKHWTTRRNHHHHLQQQLLLMILKLCFQGLCRFLVHLELALQLTFTTRLEPKDVTTEGPLGHVDIQAGGCDEKFVQILAIPAWLSGTLHRHVDLFYHFGIRGDPNNLVAIKDTCPQVSFIIDVGTVRHSLRVQRCCVEEKSPVAWGAWFFVIVPYKDFLQCAVTDVPGEE